MIPEVDTVATEIEDNVLNVHTVLGLDTPMIDAIGYMGRPPRTAYLAQSSDHLACSPHLKGSFLRPTNMRSTFVLLTQSNLPPLLMLPRPIMSLFSLHIHLHLGSLIQEPLIISLVIKIFFFSYLSVSFTSYYLS